MRFTLGHESAAGWHIFDSARMRTFYANVESKARAKAYVEAINVIDSYRTDQERAARRGDAELLAILEGRYHDAA